MDTRNLLQDEDDTNNDTTLHLVTGLVNDTRELLSAHVDAARLEIKEEISEITRGLKEAVAAMVVGGVGAILLGIAVSAALVAAGLTTWIAYGLVALVAIGVAVGLGIAARREIGSNDAIPSREIERAKHDARWIAKRARAAAQDPERQDTH